MKDVNRIYLGGLPWPTEAAEIADLCRPFGAISSVDVRTDPLTRRSMGFAFVEFAAATAASEAAAMLNGTAFRGRNILVSQQREYEPPPLQSRASGRLPDAGWPGYSAFRGFTADRVVLDAPQRLLLVSQRVTDKLVELLAREPETLRSAAIDSRLLEEIVAELWHGFGYDVELTARTRDGGRDVIAIRSHLVEERFLIECKHPLSGRPIGVGVVRELYGVFQHERATKAILATTHRFSRDAMLFIQQHRWEIDGKDYDGLCTWIHRYMDLKRRQSHGRLTSR